MNINEIAKLAGVSRATVSRYLNNGYVSDEKKDQIKKVIDKHSYVPSNQARNLRTKKTNLIGVIIPKINSYSVSLLVAGISSELSKEDFKIILGDTENDEKEEIRFLEMFKTNYVDGIILLGSIFTKKHFEVMKELNVPIVVAGQKVPKYSCVFSDNYLYTKELVTKMLKKCKKLAYITVTEKDKSVGFERKSAYIDACEEQNREIFIETSEFGIRDGYNSAKKLLEKHHDIDGIFCATDSIAIGAMKYLKESGKNIPSDIIIAGVGNSQLGEFTEPELTTIDMHYHDIGRESAKIIMELISEEKTVEKQMVIASKIIERSSSSRV